MRRYGLAFLLLFCAVAGFVMFRSDSVVALDFRAFYCAGTAVREHADPYVAGPLHACETRQTDWQFRSHVGTAALPAPLPAYDLSAFSALSKLPFDVAKWLWGALLGIAIGLAIVALIRVTRLSALLVFCALSTSLIGPSLALGQLVPVFIAAACCAMLFVQQQRYRAAAIAAAISMVEPHLGLPLCIALAIWVPKSRLALITCTAVLAIVALATGGVAQNLEYVFTVLPLHALSELPSDGQLSLSAILHAAGLSDGQSLAAGGISYILFGAAGIAAAPVIGKRFDDAAFVIAVPAATAVLGGSFMHGTDVVAAIPLALLLLARLPQQKHLAIAALVLIMTPWWAALNDASALLPWFAFSAVAVFCVVWSALGEKVLPALAFAGIVAVVLFALGADYARARATYMAAPHAVRVSIDTRYPEASWARAVGATFSTGSAASWLIRAPTWTGLILLFGALAATRRTPEQQPA